MQRFIYTALFLFVNFHIYSIPLNERINCIIFIDGKLPTGIYDEYFFYYDSNRTKRKIDFTYMIGEIWLTPENKNLLYSLNLNSEIMMHLSYKKYDGKSYNYSGTIKVAWLRYPYLVIRITNLKKKGGYYFACSTPYEIQKFIKQEYDMFEEY